MNKKHTPENMRAPHDRSLCLVQYDDSPLKMLSHLSLELEDLLVSFHIKLLHFNAGRMTHHFLDDRYGNCGQILVHTFSVQV
jgi:hypothetical protein